MGWLLRVPSQGYHHFPHDFWFQDVRFGKMFDLSTGGPVPAKEVCAAFGQWTGGADGDWNIDLFNFGWRKSSTNSLLSRFSDNLCDFLQNDWLVPFNLCISHKDPWEPILWLQEGLPAWLLQSGLVDRCIVWMLKGEVWNWKRICWRHLCFCWKVYDLLDYLTKPDRLIKGDLICRETCFYLSVM